MLRPQYKNTEQLLIIAHTVCNPMHKVLPVSLVQQQQQQQLPILLQILRHLLQLLLHVTTTRRWST